MDSFFFCRLVAHQCSSQGTEFGKGNVILAEQIQLNLKHDVACHVALDKLHQTIITNNVFSLEEQVKLLVCCERLLRKLPQLAKLHNLQTNLPIYRQFKTNSDPLSRIKLLSLLLWTDMMNMACRHC